MVPWYHGTMEPWYQGTVAHPSPGGWGPTFEGSGGRSRPAFGGSGRQSPPEFETCGFGKSLTLVDGFGVACKFRVGILFML